MTPRSDGAQEPTGRLGSAVRRGVAWKLGAVAANQLLRLATVVVVARALAPEEFGLAAMALSAWALVSVLTDFALAAALVQRLEIDETDRSTAFWAGVAAGVALALAGLACSGALAAFFGEPKVQWLFAALTLVALFNSLAATHVALLTRALAFRTLELVSVTSTLAGAAAGIALALGGAGAWALVANAVVSAAVSCALIWWRSAWRPTFGFSRSRFRHLFAFAATLSATRLVVALQRSGDRVLVGRFLGASALGAYAVPASLVLVPTARLVDPIRSVLFPALSRMQESRSELADAWLRVTQLVVGLLAPVLATLALAAPHVVELVLGPGWSDSAPILRILALAALVHLATSMNAVVLTVLGRIASVLRVFVITLVLSVVGFLVGKRHGLEGAAAGYAASLLVVAPVYVRLTARTLGVPARALAAAFLPPSAGLVAMAAAFAGLELALRGHDPSAAAYVVAVGATAAVYALVALPLSPALRRDLRLVVSRDGVATESA